MIAVAAASAMGFAMLAAMPVSAQVQDQRSQAEVTVPTKAGPGASVETAPDGTPYERYVFASFHGGDDGGRNGEQIWLSASKGNDPLNWYELNYDEGTAVSQPILQTVNPAQGQMGLRDPSLIRSADGKKFFLLATDLKTYQDGQSWSYRQSRGSRNLVVYESTDLVNWSDARFIKVEDDHAGNVWAPEAFYDESRGEYIVFWASNLYPDENIATRNTQQISYNRIRIATTKDFVTFTEPKTWINLDRSTGRQGWGMIDSTMIATDDRIYRLTKDENGFRVLLQYISSLDDLHDTWGEEETEPYAVNKNPITPLTTMPNAWTMVGNPNGSSKWQVPGLNGGNLEGPLVFKDNAEDMYYVFIDYASGGGYVAWRAPSMDVPPNQWEYLGQSWCNRTGLSSTCNAQDPASPYWSLPVSPRHGSVIPVTLEEWETLMAGYNSPVHVEASVVTAGGDAVPEDEWLNEAPELEVTWTDFNDTGLAPAWLRLVEGHNGGSRVVSAERITSGITQGMTVPVNAVEGTNWAQLEYRDASLGGDAVMLWTPDVSYKLDTTAPVVGATVDGFELSVSVTDPLPAGVTENSGIASCEYRVGDGAWAACADTVDLGAAISDRTVTVVATDNAGNETTVQVAAQNELPETIDELAAGNHMPRSVVRDLQKLLDAAADAEAKGDGAEVLRQLQLLTAYVAAANVSKIDAEAWDTLWPVLLDYVTPQSGVATLQQRVGDLTRSGDIATSTGRDLHEHLAAASAAPTAQERAAHLQALRTDVASARVNKVSQNAKAALLALIDDALGS
ncbi:glycoside hydrolase family 43 protein [Motilibacter aurantiacus]|uniref:glycoside hydrolase family 43 protein n=1 Tax=Motilibacter aurantiacus TaxID=2714955 RepID=UPI0014083DCF|nr:glycoside hydrolase family 43 protein [Motilibacter aurantiacus]NHC47591.1 glycoside hydrolase family 43 protein [Motilibacter aurantiacus]